MCGFIHIYKVHVVIAVIVVVVVFVVVFVVVVIAAAAAAAAAASLVVTIIIFVASDIFANAKMVLSIKTRRRFYFAHRIVEMVSREMRYLIHASITHVLEVPRLS